MDIDILLCGRLHFTTESLTVPHPELPNRDFWRREVAELEALSPARA